MEEQLAELKRREAACAANRDYIAVLPRLRASAASQGEGGWRVQRRGGGL